MNDMCGYENRSHDAPEEHVHIDRWIRNIENHEADVLMKKIERVRERAQQQPAATAETSYALNETAIMTTKNAVTIPATT